MSDGNKNCFVIAPIGKPETETRKRSDQVFKYLLEPASRECGFEAIRADHIKEPGIITSQVIQHIMDDPIVIADLTDRNPNVFYELAIRHILRKPFVQIIKQGEEKPFDVAGIRTIEFDHHDLDSVFLAKEQIISQINSMKSEGYTASSPISVTIDSKLLSESDKPEERQLADVFAAIADMKSELSSIGKRVVEQPGFYSRKKIVDKDIRFDKLNLLIHSLAESVELSLKLRSMAESLKHIVIKSERDESKINQPEMKESIEELSQLIFILTNKNYDSLNICEQFHTIMKGYE
jgi:hypothetical protein